MHGPMEQQITYSLYALQKHRERRGVGGVVGGMGFGIEGNTDQKVCWTPYKCVLSLSKHGHE